MLLRIHVSLAGKVIQWWVGIESKFSPVQVSYVVCHKNKCGQTKVYKFYLFMVGLLVLQKYTLKITMFDHYRSTYTPQGAAIIHQLTTYSYMYIAVNQKGTTILSKSFFYSYFLFMPINTCFKLLNHDTLNEKIKKKNERLTTLGT